MIYTQIYKRKSHWTIKCFYIQQFLAKSFQLWANDNYKIGNNEANSQSFVSKKYLKYQQNIERNRI